MENNEYWQVALKVRQRSGDVYSVLQQPQFSDPQAAKDWAGRRVASPENIGNLQDIAELVIGYDLVNVREMVREVVKPVADYSKLKTWLSKQQAEVAEKHVEHVNQGDSQYIQGYTAGKLRAFLEAESEITALQLIGQTTDSEPEPEYDF